MSHHQRQQKELARLWRRKRKSNVLNCDTNHESSNGLPRTTDLRVGGGESFSAVSGPAATSSLHSNANAPKAGTIWPSYPMLSKRTLAIMNKQTTYQLLLNNLPVILFTCIALFTSIHQAVYLPPNATSATQEGQRDGTSGSNQQAAMAMGPQSNAVAPTIDYSHNMRILKLPKSTPPGSLVYRLKGSDADPNTQLSFGVSGGFGIGRTLLEVVPVAHSWNEADVYLRSQLEQPLYNLTVYVTDGNKTTQVESTLMVTNDELELGAADSEPGSGSGSNNTGSMRDAGGLPFVNPRHVFHVPENAKLTEPIGYVSVLESSKSDLPVRFELRGKGSERFAIKYVFGPKGQSKGEIILARELDYERQNLFSLKVLALNAWTNPRLDTRNVATLDIVITVGDLQDTPPVFRSLPRSINLASSLEANALVARVEAEDGDYADQRPVQYALDANSPLASYFSINKATGEIYLLKPASELALHAAWDSADWSMLTVFASELPDTTSYDHLWPPMYARAEVPLRLVELANEPPQFVGGWQSGADAETRLLRGYLNELTGQESDQDLPIHQVSWFTNASDTGQPLVDQLVKSMAGRPLALDLGLGGNGTFELTLEGPDRQLFQLEPAFPVVKQTSFALIVSPQANRSLLDFENSANSKRSFHVEIVARDFGQPERKSGRIKCQIDLVDLDDNSAQFEIDLYTFNVYENAQPGTLLGTVKARDPDSPANGRFRYSLAGSARDARASDTFRLDPDGGQLTLLGGLDREKRPSYLLLVEARDGALSTGSERASNFTQVLINVLDVNDNAPQFLQSHYDAVLLADGTFHQPLVVRALDADEPNTANSQVAYEIIAGNGNEQFSIDSVSGVVYPTLFGSPGSPAGDYFSTNKNAPTALPQIPPLLSEPIVPFFNPNQNQAGKILPAAHEIEEAPPAGSWRAPRVQASNKLRDSVENETISRQKAPISVEITGAGQPPKATSQVPLWFRRQQQREQPLSPGQVDAEQLPALDVLLNLESEASFNRTASSHVIEDNDKRRSLPAGSGPSYQPANGNLMRLPPITTLVVRAHDFGIPLRSSTVRVNIFNQALLSRSVSVILNGTADQLELRREAIERAFSSLTGSRASIESIDALSESSSISIARVKLSVPQHSLVDLTDLSALMNAIDYKPTSSNSDARHPQNTITHYVNEAGKLVPINHSTANITHQAPGLYTDQVHSYQLDDGQQLERRLLIYIIIVVVCIAILLLVWIVYYCTRESGERARQLEQLKASRKLNYPNRQGSQESPDAAQPASARTTPKSTQVSASGNSPIGNQLGKFSNQKQAFSQERGSTTNTSELLLAPEAAAAAAAANNNNNRYLSVGAGGSSSNLLLKPEHMSMYNGQVWFEPAGSGLRAASARRARLSMGRRASSAPSGNNSLDSVALISGSGPRDASGQFFPNTIGYMENLDALSAMTAERLPSVGGGSRQRLGPFNGRRRHRVAPLPAGQGHLNEAFEPDEAGSTRRKGRKMAGRRDTSSIRSASSAGGSSLNSDSQAVMLDSDQELLGFDSTGTPIIATHTQPASGRPLKTLVVDVLEPAQQQPGSRKSLAASNNPSKGEEEESLAVANSAEAKEKVAAVAQRKAKPEAAEKGPAEQNQDFPNKSVGQKETSPQGDLMGELNGRLAARRKQSDGILGQDNQRNRSGSGAGPALTRGEPVEERVEPGGSAVTRSGSSGAESINSAEKESRPNGEARGRLAGEMKNGELLEKQSIFAITYSGLATDKLPA